MEGSDLDKFPTYMDLTHERYGLLDTNEYSMWGQSLLPNLMLQLVRSFSKFEASVGRFLDASSILLK